MLLTAYPPTVPAFVAFVAFVALVAFVAFVALVALSALVAWSAFPADGTFGKPETLTFAPVTAPFLIFGVVTAFFLSCFVPTLFFGKTMFAAAYVVPLNAMNSASSAIVFWRKKRPNLPVMC
jgi:hypothetical protein